MDCNKQIASNRKSFGHGNIDKLVHALKRYIALKRFVHSPRANGRVLKSIGGTNEEERIVHLSYHAIASNRTIIRTSLS